MKHYNLISIKADLESRYPHPMYKHFTGCLLNICNDLNEKKIDLNTPVGEFLGHTAGNVLKTNGIFTEEIITT